MAYHILDFYTGNNRSSLKNINPVIESSLSIEKKEEQEYNTMFKSRNRRCIYNGSGSNINSILAKYDPDKLYHLHSLDDTVTEVPVEIKKKPKLKKRISLVFQKIFN